MFSVRLFACLLACATLLGFPGRARELPLARHWLVQVVRDRDGFRVVKATSVESPLPKRRDARRFYPWKIKALGADGRVLYSAGIDDPTVLRGEFANRRDPKKIDAVHLQKKEPVHFSIRLPAKDIERIVFYRIKPECHTAAPVPREAYAELGSADFPGKR
jgi:hypothetical protein